MNVVGDDNGDAKKIIQNPSLHNTCNNLTDNPVKLQQTGTEGSSELPSKKTRGGVRYTK